MIRSVGGWAASFAASIVFLCPPVRAAETPGEGVLEGTSPSGGAVVFPLTHTHARILVVGPVETTVVEQTFENPASEPIEAVYTFPLPQDAAVDRFEMVVGERVVRGRVEERSQARQTYEQARDDGRRAGLLEQERPNVFTVSVANLDAGLPVKVTLRYVRALKYEDGGFTVRFPMVVAPRYVPGAAVGTSGTGKEADTDRVPDASRITPALLAEGERPGNAVTIEARIVAGVEIRELSSLTHEVTETRVSPAEVSVALTRKEAIPNKDFVLRFKVAGDRPQSALLGAGGEGSDGHFFLFLVPQAGTPSEDAIVAREVTFVVDRSGSMQGDKFLAAQGAVKGFLAKLRPIDAFQIVAFCNAPMRFSHGPVSADASSIARAERWVDDLRAEGGTEILAALEEAMPPVTDEGPGERMQVVVVITDGQIGNEAEVFKRLEGRIGFRRVHTLGIDQAPNDWFLEKLARRGGGVCRILLGPNEIAEAVESLSSKLSAPVVTNVAVDLAGATVDEVCPDRVPDLYAGQTVLVKGRLRMGSTAVKAVMRATGPAGEFKEEVPLVLLDDPDAAAGLASMWARARVEELEDRMRTEPSNEATLKAEIVRIGVERSIVTAYTSFVVVDEEARASTSRGTRTCAQPVALPEGWSGASQPAHRYQRPPAAPAQSGYRPAQSPYAPVQPSQPSITPPAYQPPPRQSSPSGGSSDGWGPRIGGGAVSPFEWALLGSLGVGAWLRRRRTAPKGRPKIARGEAPGDPVRR